MKKLITLFLFLFISSVQARVELPSSILTPNQIVEEFRGAFRVKLLELERNYYALYSDRSISYRSHEPVTCDNKSYPPGSNLARVELTSKQSGDDLFQSIRYFGCGEKLVMQEHLQVVGGNDKPLTFSQVRKGEISLNLKAGEKKRFYRILYGDQTELFSLSQEATPTGEFHEYKIARQLAFQITFLYSEDSSRVTYKYFPYNLKVQIGQSEWTMNMGFTPYTNIANAFSQPRNYVTYFDSSNSQVSEGTFLTNFGYNIRERTLDRLGSFIRVLMNELPPTAVVSTGTQNQRLLEELRLNYTRLLNNTEPNLVRNYLQELILAAEKGQVQDNRPAGQ